MEQHWCHPFSIAGHERGSHRAQTAAPAARCTAGTPTPQTAATIAAVRRYFSGERVEFADVQLDLGAQNDFFMRIYLALRRVCWGQTTTYGALAKELGAAPEAARDVGQAMANNPIPLLIPCHRVLAAGGRLGGFSAPGGTAAKSRLLELEGVAIARARTEASQTQHSLDF